MDVENRIQKASCAFGCLCKHLFSNPAMSKPTMRVVYEAIFLSILLYGAETWLVLDRETGCLVVYFPQPLC